MSFKMVLSGKKPTAWFLPQQGEMRKGVIFNKIQKSDTTDMKRVKREYYEWFYAYKFDKVNEKDQVFECNQLIKLI